MLHIHKTIFALCLLGFMGCAEPDTDESVDEGVPRAQKAEEAAPVCSGRPGRLRGKSRQNVRAGGLNRTFIYYAPQNLDPNQPAPLVIVPHGYTMNDQQMFDITQYAALADREGFVVAFPDAGPGVGLGPWNVGQGICGNGQFVTGLNDDQAFVDAMIDFADRDRCVDREHVFMNGFSMGGYFSNESACVNPKIKGVAPHSGGTHNLNRCLDRKVPVLVLHFQPDTLIGYNCGVDARNKWAERNGCTLQDPEIEQLQNGRCEYYRDCAEGGQVAMCTFQNGLFGGGELLRGHGWAGGSKAGSGDLFSIPGPSSATELSWSFFKKYAW